MMKPGPGSNAEVLGTYLPHPKKKGGRLATRKDDQNIPPDGAVVSGGIGGKNTRTFAETCTE
jgi:hypothetical protein